VVLVDRTVGIPSELLETYVSHVLLQESLQKAHGSESRASVKTYTVTTRSIQSQSRIVMELLEAAGRYEAK
jgi:hypothetical protein